MLIDFSNDPWLPKRIYKGGKKRKGYEEPVVMLVNFNLFCHKQCQLPVQHPVFCAMHVFLCTKTNRGKSTVSVHVLQIHVLQIHLLQIHVLQIHLLQIHVLQIHVLQIHLLQIHVLQIHLLQIHVLQIHVLQIHLLQIHVLQIHVLQIQSMFY